MYDVMFRDIQSVGSTDEASGRKHRETDRQYGNMSKIIISFLGRKDF